MEDIKDWSDERVELAADALERAGDVIMHDGLIKDRYGFDNGPKCVLGALRYVVFGSIITVAPTHEQVRTLHDTFMKMQSVVGSWVLEWNDHPDRTADEIIDVLKHAAKDLRNTRGED